MAEPAPSGTIDPYAHGYRDGFRDGWKEGHVAPAAGGGKDEKDEKDGKDQDKPGAGAGEEKKADDGKKGDSDKKDGAGGDDDKDKDKDGKDKDGKDKDGKDKKPLYKRPLLVALVLAAILIAIIVAFLFWRHSSHHEKTDDAFIDGHASAVSAQTAGRVIKLHVVDNQTVHAGDLLLEIDSRDADASLAQARARLADARSQLETAKAQVEVRRAATVEAAASTRQSQAELAKAQQDLSRFRGVDPDAVPRQQTDTAATTAVSAKARLDAARSTEQSTRAQVTAAEAQVKTAQAGIEAAQASIDAAQLQVSYGQVVAPIDGHVTRRTIEVGNVVAAGQPLMSVVSDELWVTANYKETQLTKMQPGQHVSITVDAYPDVKFDAHVDSVQRGTGSYFSMLPAENATGNYVKVVQRVPVKIVFDDIDKVRRYPIGPGMSVTPDVDIP